MDRNTLDTHNDLSPVTFHAELGQWATALALLEGGVPRDHATPPGSILEQVIRDGADMITDADRKDPVYHAFIAATK